MTPQEKVEASSLQIVITHCLAKAILFSTQIPLEHHKLLEPEMVDALKQLKNKASFLNKKVHASYVNDVKASAYTEGVFDLTDEMAVQVIEAVEKIISKPKNQILS